MKLTLLFISLVTIAGSCSKSKSPSNNNLSPTNLTVTAVISNDSSGKVSFTAAATNAVSYVYDYGDGESQTVASGIMTYKYPSSGSYTVNVTAKSAGGQTLSKSILVTVTVILSLKWSDEFDTPGSPDVTRWGYEIGDGCPNVCGWGNNELEWYTNRPENVIVQGGVLKITAVKESFNGKPYTSARLISKDKYSFKYGKIEVKAKLPAGGGTWPAIWMLGNNINTVGWPAGGEIDIMEHRGNYLNTISGALHHPGHSGGNADARTVNIPNVSTEFHRYAVEWTPLSIKFLVDDSPFFTFVNTRTLPFNQNFFIILNVAMGGNFGGPVDPAFTSAAMEIDYVRVYQ